MDCSVYDLKAFYESRAGRLMRRILGAHIYEFWPDLKDMRVLGCGYAMPYLSAFQDKTERAVALTTAQAGVHHWPAGRPGKVALAEEALLPLETESVDRILLIHGFEFSRHPDELLQELWRVLKSNGRLLIVVPNRLGMWARADWTPFGHGTPYTAGQITRHLERNLFVHERTDRGLFMPPFRSFMVLRTAYSLESFGHFFFPGLAGVHLVEASKQLYAGAGRAKTAKGQRVLVAKPVTTS
ncbi:MAG: methyltransferase domain-containing protein [Rhodospirillales bacterium]|nr:methyltransferase domain-containing protein [Rhodospirillales bacterium]